MAGKKISQLGALGGSFAATDLFEISKDEGGGTYSSKKITGTEMITSIGAGTVTSVAVSGGTTGLTTSGGPITTSGTITIGGALVAANGGTGQTSYSTGDILYASGATALSKLAAGTDTHVLTLAGGVPTWAAPANPTQNIIVAASDETTALTTGTAKVTFRMPYAFTLTAVRASVTTAPVGSVLTVDINEAGSTILSTKITIDASEKTSTTAATPPVISDSALADDAEITVDIDTVGSGTAGAGLKVTLIGTKT